MVAPYLIAAAAAALVATLDVRRSTGRFWVKAKRWFVLMATVDISVSALVAWMAQSVLDADSQGAVAAISVVALMASQASRLPVVRLTSFRTLILDNARDLASSHRAMWVVTTVYPAAKALGLEVLVPLAHAAIRDQHRLGRKPLESSSAVGGLPRRVGAHKTHLLVDLLLDHPCEDTLFVIVKLHRRMATAASDSGGVVRALHLKPTAEEDAS